MKLPAFLILVLLFVISACDKEEEEFYFELDDLLETHWGIPHVIEPGQEDIDLAAPTIFYPDGYVNIGPDRTDFWRIKDSRSIFLDEAGEDWFFINLSPDTMYVEKTKYPQGIFLGKYIYHPMEYN